MQKKSVPKKNSGQLWQFSTYSFLQQSELQHFWLDLHTRHWKTFQKYDFQSCLFFKFQKKRFWEIFSKSLIKVPSWRFFMLKREFLPTSQKKNFDWWFRIIIYIKKQTGNVFFLHLSSNQIQTKLTFIVCAHALVKRWLVTLATVPRLLTGLDPLFLVEVVAGVNGGLQGLDLRGIA